MDAAIDYPAMGNYRDPRETMIRRVVAVALVGPWRAIIAG